jgi:hypothetical protein
MTAMVIEVISYDITIESRITNLRFKMSIVLDVFIKWIGTVYNIVQ